jgi:hypothetical protein
MLLKMPNGSHSLDGSGVLCAWGSGSQIQRTTGLAQKKTTEINLSRLLCDRINRLS